MKNLSDSEKKVLQCLAGIYSDEMNCVFYSYLTQETKLTLTQVKRATHSLIKKELVEYIRGLFDDDGMVAGSGHSATEKGMKLVEELKL